MINNINSRRFSRLLWPRVILSSFISSAQLGCSNDVSFESGEPLTQAQASGQDISENFTQGVISKKLDILFIVDNSGSMSEEQQKMGDKIDSFIANLHDVDWQIGITTTDVSDGTYGIKGSLLKFEGTRSRILTRNTPNYKNVFLNTVTREESINCGSSCASGDEQPLAAARLAIQKRNTANKGFFRDGADLGLLILTDEDEKSDGRTGATTPQSVFNYVERVWDGDKKLLTYGMIIRPGDTMCFDANGGQGRYGTFVTALYALTGGFIGSICDADYGDALGDIADSARRLTEYVKLKFTPIPETILVSFEPSHTATWTVEGKRLFLNPPPPKGTVISVNYTAQ